MSCAFRTADDVVRKVPARPNVSPQVSELRLGLVAPFLYAIGLENGSVASKTAGKLECRRVLKWTVCGR